MVVAGVYTITHVGGGHYVGQSGDVAHRWRMHRYQLRRGRHPSWALQVAWDRDGAEAFTWTVLEECASGPERRARERALVRETRPVYNAPLHARQDAAGRAPGRASVRTPTRPGTQRGERRMSAERERVSMNARVERALRDKARQTAEARGMALVDLIAAAVEAYCAEPSAPPAAAAVVATRVAPQAAPGELADLEEILRLVRTTVADVHMIREVLVQTRPRQELEAARETTRGWLSALRIARRADSRP